MMIPNAALFSGFEKHQADLFRSCQKVFLSSAVEVFMLLYVYIYPTKMMCFPSFFGGVDGFIHIWTWF
jgi:hypothetical protein